jgi:transcriptional regulator with XRE-family HTH domain
MAQQPAKRHVLADLRIECGLSQRQMAKLVGVAAISIQRIEQGTLGLSEELAAKVEYQFDVSASWLLENNRELPPFTPRHRLWGPEMFERQQGMFKILNGPESNQTPPRKPRANRTATDDKIPKDALSLYIDWFMAENANELRAMFEGSRHSSRIGILCHRIRAFRESLRADFPPDDAALDRTRATEERLKQKYFKQLSEATGKEHQELWDNLMKR